MSQPDPAAHQSNRRQMPQKIVATLFYKSHSPTQHPHVHPDTILASHSQTQLSNIGITASNTSSTSFSTGNAGTGPSNSFTSAGNDADYSIHSNNSTSDLPAPCVQPGTAPTTDMDSYPLEPPPPGPEPLDHLYGPYVSTTCLAHFHRTLAAVVPGYDESKSVTRSLEEDTTQPRVVEVTFEVPTEGGQLAAATTAAAVGVADGSLDTIVDSPTAAMSMDAALSAPLSSMSISPSSKSRSFGATTGSTSGPTSQLSSAPSSSSASPPSLKPSQPQSQLQPPPSIEDIRRDELVSRFEQEWDIEAVFQADSVYRTHKRLAVFDMDSTLIQQEIIDELARVAGVEPAVAAITARAMNGELDFEASLRSRCKMLKGLKADVWESLKSEPLEEGRSRKSGGGVVTLTPGARDLVRCLKRLGYKTALLSGGFMPMATWLAKKLDIDYAYANMLEVEGDASNSSNSSNVDVTDNVSNPPSTNTLTNTTTESRNGFPNDTTTPIPSNQPSLSTLISTTPHDTPTTTASQSTQHSDPHRTPFPPSTSNPKSYTTASSTLTGALTGPIITPARKASLVRAIAAREHILPQQTLVVGDGANDLPMLRAAGLGVAFNAKSRVQMEAPARLNSRSLADVLCLVGVGRRGRVELLGSKEE